MRIIFRILLGIILIPLILILGFAELVLKILLALSSLVAGLFIFLLVVLAVFAAFTSGWIGCVICLGMALLFTWYL